jgi:DNA-binding transcriptional ArsR family regulator/uncharacterized protein YndB with AHSA1/START domain
MTDMDALFRALNDSHRRQILDILHESDGMTSSEIEAKFHDITRFGVMKHLKMLEEAYLITTHKEGRFKYHYLNAAPLQEMADRWISRFAAPWVQSMADVKTQLEKENRMTTKPKHIYVSVIKTTPDRLWAALTDGKITPAYYYGGKFEGEIKAGAEYRYTAPDGGKFLSGTILEANAPHKLVATFKGEWMPGMENDAPTRVTYDILQQGDCCRLTLTHDEFEGETATYHNTGGGWPGILSGLKTLLETGQPLNYNPMAA